jgi:predicted Zn finger-like uncharacterized protein
MRLTCPNCDAHYEVDDDAIPAGGRDVQCSNCGHAWYQYPPGLEPDDDDLAAIGPAPSQPPAPPPVAEVEDDARHGRHVPPPSVYDDEDEPADPPPAAVPPRRAPLDESLRAVLREEAAREAAARRGEPALPIEVQPEFDLPPRTAARATALPGVAVAAAAAVPASVAPAADAPPAARAASRRDLLPDIDQINSTLRGKGETAEAVAAVAEEAERRRGFRTGFLAVVALAVLATVVYSFAQQIGRAVPALQGPLAAYVAASDSLRGGLDTLVERLIAMARDAGGE